MTGSPTILTSKSIAAASQAACPPKSDEDDAPVDMFTTGMEEEAAEADEVELWGFWSEVLSFLCSPEPPPLPPEDDPAAGSELPRFPEEPPPIHIGSNKSRVSFVSFVLGK